MRIDFAKKKLWLLNFFLQIYDTIFRILLFFCLIRLNLIFAFFTPYIGPLLCSSFTTTIYYIEIFFDIHNLKTNLKKTEHETGNGGFFRYIIHIFRGEKRFGF